MLAASIVQQNRQANTENGLYLKMLVKATKAENL